jgi:anti-sigma regulatory factor (Ser/Thr protein kinase)/thioesterase domain-containing protein
VPGPGALFEDLGGDSLTVIMLALQIELSFGKVISPTELFAAATLEAQAELIDAANADRVAASNESGCLEPLFFVHSANSGAEAYRRFMEALPESQPLYVFENHNILFSEGKFEGIAELARRYVGYLPPSGHYRLGGWSLGGLIAFEMGLILQQQGIMSDLYLIDPYIMTSDAERELDAGLEPEQSYFRDYLNRDALFERFRDAGLIERLVSNNNFVRREAARYSPTDTFNGKTILFKAMKEDPRDSEVLRRLWEMKSPDNGFAGFTNDLRLVQIDSTHDRWINDPLIIKTIVSEVIEEVMEKNLTIHATEENLVTAQEFVARELQENGFTAKMVTQTMIAVEEIFVNIAHYAYDGKGDTEISFFMENGTAVITFADSGKPYNPLEEVMPDVTSPAEDRPVGGLGIFMTRRLTDGIEYERVNECNILRIKKNRDKGSCRLT